MKSDMENLQKRGFIDRYDESSYQNYGRDELLDLLNSMNAQERSIAANQLKEYPDKKVISALCLRLSIEKSLYTKLIICDSLRSIGKKAVPEMLKYLGKIGKNQYKEIPEAEFKKKSYPLPRDIIARTLAHMDKEILPELISVLDSGNIYSIREVIDSIGFICFYNSSDYPAPYLLRCYKKYDKDPVVCWKIIRAFRSFNNMEIIKILDRIIENEKNIYIKREAGISLRIIKDRNK
jgi:hypothetical protein